MINPIIKELDINCLLTRFELNPKEKNVPILYNEVINFLFILKPCEFQLKKQAILNYFNYFEENKNFILILSTSEFNRLFLIKTKNRVFII